MGDADIGVDPPQLGGRTVAPAVVVDRIGEDIERDVALPHADLRLSGAPPERAAAQLGLAALVVEAIFHLDRDGAAQRVEPEHRVARVDVEPLDRPVRDEVPVDRVAERLVDAHAVLIDRETLRHADDRRRHEAAVARRAGTGSPRRR
jgi:hypothetical protein